MRHLLNSLAILALGFVAACGPKAAPNVSPAGVAQLKADKYIVALSDFQDGVAFAFHSGWLSARSTNLVAQSLEVAVKSIHAYPTGAKAVTITALDELEANLKNEPDYEKFIPYLESVKAVVEAI